MAKMTELERLRYLVNDTQHQINAYTTRIQEDQATRGKLRKELRKLNQQLLSYQNTHN